MIFGDRRSARRFAKAFAFSWTCVAGAVGARELDCGPALPVSQPKVEERRPVTTDDLVRLRDVGWPASVAVTGPNAISLSPDGTKVAFLLQRAEPAGNKYCLGLYVANITAPSHLVEADRGGELIRLSVNRTGITDFPSGVPKIITPRWSPDGGSIAFLKRTDGVTRIWMAAAQGGSSYPLATSSNDVEDFSFTKDGQRIVFVTRPALQTTRDRIDDEGKHGYRFDDRYVPKASSRPFPPATTELMISTIDLVSMAITAANADEKRLFNQGGDAGRGELGTLFAKGASGKLAWIRLRDPKAFNSTTELVAEKRNGGFAPCALEICSAIVGLWWNEEETAVRFMRREGWSHSQLAVYSWKPGSGLPRREFATEDLLANCQSVVADELICLHESASQPRRLVRVGARGAITPIIEFNPEFAHLDLGPVERLRWKNAFGVETFGDLVLPPTYNGETSLPLVIVQYDSRGFLRGGTGDEYPIYPLAARGFAVLSFERPLDLGYQYPARNVDELVRNNMTDWRDLTSVLSSLEIVIERLVQRGIVDPKRVGISGLSDGTRNIQYALLHSDKFAAASVSSSFEEPGLLIPLAGPAGERNYVNSGYPPRGDEDPAFWACYSLAQNAGVLRTPVLMQLSEDEYLGALETFAAFQRKGVPTALYVFPGEHHVKWQPEHRLAVYNRNIAWFLNWLRPEADPAFVNKWLAPLPEKPPSSSSGAHDADDQCSAHASASASANKRK